MNTAMWNHPVTSEHLEKITKWGYTVIEPISKGNLFDLEMSRGSSDQNQFIFQINVGKRRIRHVTTLKLKDEFLDRIKSVADSNSKSLYVGSASFRY